MWKALSRTDGARCGLSLLNAMTCRQSAAVKCRKPEVSPAARPSSFCATSCTVLPNRCATSSSSDSGHITATSTLVNDVANARVSSKRQRYRAVTAGEGRLSVRRVLTMPGFGAFAIMTNVRFGGEKHTVVWLEDSMRDWSIVTYSGGG